MTVRWSDGLTQTYTQVDIKKEYMPTFGRNRLTYTYKDKYSGLWYYYCSLNRAKSTLLHSSNGNSMEFIGKCW